MTPPPPPPPHSEAPPKSSGLPPGKYDIFVIPQHSAGSGFLYLPSLQPNVNSFAAGFACALIMVAIFQSMAPAFQAWWASFQGMGSMGMTMLMVAIGVGAWALGRMQQEMPSSTPGTPPGATPGATGGGAGAYPGTASGSSSGAGPGTGPAPNAGQPPPPPPHDNPPPNQGASPNTDGPKSSWQQRPPPQPGTSNTEAPKGSWEKAREETRRREEERKAKEEEQKRREETARKLREQREREAREREQREREARERRERLEAERRERELRERLEQERMERERLQREKDERDRIERIERERLERLERERVERREQERLERLAREERERQERIAREEKERKEKLEEEERERREREEREATAAREARERELAEMRKREEAEAKAARKASTYAFSGVGEKINPWPNGKPKPRPVTVTDPSPPPTPPKAPPSTSGRSTATYATYTPDKRPPAPSVRTCSGGTDEEAYSYRPYDKPKQPKRKNSTSSVSEMSWAPSQTTARTTPPPSTRGPYVTRDPDKIVIKAVYLFMNQFSKTPASQLLSGVGSVTDGLILRITTEGLFIDDDVRGVPQREWDVKAWTLKQVEVWCPPHCLTPSSRTPGATKDSPNVLHKGNGQRIRDRGGTKLFTGDEAEVYLTELLHACKDCCRAGRCESTFKNTNIPSPSGQTGEWTNKGLHVLRATIRDQEAKRYLFVVDETESWKVAVGLRRLRGGSQVRALGVSGMGATDARGALEMLGW